jgi:NADPH:quinone reductase-like Zn-dependent oxidoreductase
VLVRLKAASLNFLDIAVATGNFPVPAFPLVPVTDGAGEVAEVGAGVDQFRPGDRVIPHFMPRWQGGPITPANITGLRGVTLPGSLAEYASVPATALVATPTHLSDGEAATLPIAATTAWNALRAARVGPHSTVVVLGTGGVSIFVLQLAKASGARVIVTSSSDEKLERAARLGANHGVNYRRTSDWDRQVLDITDGRGADLILETGGGDTLARSINAAAFGGTVFVIGFLAGLQPTIEVLPIIGKALKVQGNNTGSVGNLREAAQAIAAMEVRPVVDQVFGFEDTAEASAHLAAGGRHFGKIGIKVP